MNELKRGVDEWYVGDDGHPVPWMTWHLEEKLPLLKGNVEFLRRFVEDRLQATSPTEVPALVITAFNELALRLQAGGSPDLRAWLAQVAKRSVSSGFRYPYLDELMGFESGRHAARIVARLLAHPFEAADAFLASAEHQMVAAAKQLGAFAPIEGAMGLLVEAMARGIPAKRISTSLPLYRLGQGARQKSVWRGFTVHTSHIGTVAATQKHVANELLRSVGLPVPRQRRVLDAATAVQAAWDIGFPVVVKPASTDFGTAVSVGVRNETELEVAFGSAHAHGAVLIEEQLPGDDHRLVVVDGRFVAAIRRRPAQVVGDGVSDVKKLLVRMAEARRADPAHSIYRAATLDDPLVQETLRRQHLTGRSIPAAGQVVMLRLNANVSTGGTYSDVTGDVHPDNARLAERAALCMGLDHAGIDFLTPDIAKPWHKIQSGICEINPTPGMGVPAIKSVLDYLFPDGSNGRIPVVVVVGKPPDASVVVEAVRERARATGRVPGAVLDGMVTIDGACACRDERPARALLELLLADAAVGLVVVQVSVDEILQYGLGVSRCDLAVFLTGLAEVRSVTMSARSTVGCAGVTLVKPTPDDLREALQVM